MNHWLQSKQYVCPKCLTRYLHDQAHHHACFECPMRPLTKRPVLIEKVYRPEAGR